MKYIYVCRECGGTSFEEDDYGHGVWCVGCDHYYSYYEYWDLLENAEDIMTTEYELQNEHQEDEDVDFDSLW
ncbi:hypothetical protein [Butyrivibrio sp. AC2005]|uniref:hypothetical protein n=1 Tax=Butyrivibrio sp. AC2005 TaxID=1280672 RepID=UPI00041656E8|nr:hypothetical protein [Butyrivibrio sp. AC2005]